MQEFIKIAEQYDIVVERIIGKNPAMLSMKMNIRFQPSLLKMIAKNVI